MSEINPENFSRAVLNDYLRVANFTLLTYPDRYSFEGAGPECLIATFGDVIILLENGEFTVDGTFEGEPWCLLFTQNETSEGMRLL